MKVAIIMIGLTFNELYDKLYYGADIDFRFNSSFFHITAGAEKNGHGITVIEYNKHPDEKSTYHNIIYDKMMLNANESVDCFLQSPLFFGKSFYDIQDNVEIIYS